CDTHLVLSPFPTRRSSDLGGVLSTVTVAESVLVLPRPSLTVAASTCWPSAPAAELHVVLQGAPLAVASVLPSSVKRTLVGSSARSEEHTSELQSRVDLVCR